MSITMGGRGDLRFGLARRCLARSLAFRCGAWEREKRQRLSHDGPLFLPLGALLEAVFSKLAEVVETILRAPAKNLALESREVYDTLV